jgi:hypothetical protein
MAAGAKAPVFFGEVTDGLKAVPFTAQDAFEANERKLDD